MCVIHRVGDGSRLHPNVLRTHVSVLSKVGDGGWTLRDPYLGILLLLKFAAKLSDVIPFLACRRGTGCYPPVLSLYASWEG